MSTGLGMKFGDWLVAMREQQMWTQPELSRRANVSLSSVQKAETHETLQLGPTAFTKIAKAFDKSATEFRQMWLDSDGKTALMLFVPNDVMEGIRRRASAMGTESVEAAALDLLARAINAWEPATRRDGSSVERKRTGKPAPPKHHDAPAKR
jgi:transcriptional regulator with XRE-family HTH domain